MTRETVWQRLSRGVRRLYYRPDWAHFAGSDWAGRIMALAVTDRYHAKQGRSTGRLVLQADGRRLAIYLKRHYRLPRWRGLLAALWPDAGWSPALEEWQHLEWARRRGLPVPASVAAGEYIGPWGRLQSFLAVEELTDMLPLHEAIPAAAARLDPVTFQHWKRTLVAELARLTRDLHGSRRFHKDLYLCHFYIPDTDTGHVPDWRGRVHLIDLHRLAHHPLTWPHWQMKDLAELLYSSDVAGVTVRDRLRFWRAYLGPRWNGWAAGGLRFGVLLKWGRLPAAQRQTEKRTKDVKIAFCYESVLPARGGCETYIADLARRLAAERHEVHLFACRWEPAALPADVHYHQLTVPRGPRFLRPYLFGAACRRALRDFPELVSIGFDKTWGLDVLYPLGGLHAASAAHNLRKHRQPWLRTLARLVKAVDLAHHAFSRLERHQYLGPGRPVLVANSRMVQQHFGTYYGIPPESVRVVHSAIDPGRFVEDDRPARRQAFRRQWGLGADETVAGFVAMNYRLKGLEPLLHALRFVPAERPFRLLVAGGARTGRWERLARRFGVADRVRFIGYCADPRNCYFAADFLVHPTFYDPCSLVVLEALACGLPVITTRSNGASELFREPTEGYLLDDPHDHARLAWAIGRLLDPEVRAAAGQAARRRAARWTFDDHYRQMRAVFAEAGKRKPLAA